MANLLGTGRFKLVKMNKFNISDYIQATLIAWLHSTIDEFCTVFLKIKPTRSAYLRYPRAVAELTERERTEIGSQLPEVCMQR